MSSIVNEAPCMVVRAACGTKCAAQFGKQYAEKHHRIPTHAEIASHVPGFGTFVYQHQRTIVRSGRRAAKKALAEKTPPAMLLAAIEEWKYIFAEMGWELGAMVSEEGYEACIRWDGNKNSPAAHKAFACNYHAPYLRFEDLQKINDRAASAHAQQAIRELFQAITEAVKARKDSSVAAYA